MEISVRRMQEMREHEYLSPYATFSDESRGRKIDEPQCDIRTCFERDRDRIIHSKAFRRLNGKTQVFLTPQGDHYRTRMTHTLEVSQIARTIAKALRLNEDLTEAIALGHDLGHTPFGHAGERALNSVCPGGFEHHLQSIRIVEFIERKNGKTMNLSWEVKDGIENHQTEGCPATLEGKIVRLSDKIAYVNHDIDDAVRGHIIEEKDIPEAYTDILGNSLSSRLNTMIHDIVSNSEGKDDIIMSDKVYDTMQALRKFMFENVYTNPIAKGQEKKAEKMLIDMFEYYVEHPEAIPEEHRNAPEGRERAVADYIACMTDRYAVAKYNELMVPTGWQVF